MAEWEDCRPGGKRHKQKAEYHDSARLGPRGNEAEACRRLFGGAEWRPHNCFRVRGQSVCVWCGSTSPDTESGNAKPCKGDRKVTISSWAFLRDAEETGLDTRARRAETALRKLAARKTCY